MKTIARLLPMLLLLPAAAADRPLLAPSVDVAVTYRVVRAVAPGGPAKIVVQETASAAKMRIDSFIFADSKAPYEGMIADRGANQLKVMIYARQAVVEGPADGFFLPGVSLTPDMRFKRGAEKKVAGFACTEWTVTPPQGDSWTSCITGNGVVLRTASPTREMEATAVKYEPLLASTFVPPPDLKRTAITPVKK